MKIKIFAILCFLSFSITAQEFSGKAVYKTSSKSNFKMNRGKNPANDALQKQIQQRLQKMNQKTYILNFNRIESTYKQDEELDAPKKPQAGGVVVMSFGGGGNNSVLYKNLKENKLANKTEIMGKSFLVKDELLKYDWVMTGETKNIGNYTCYKATFEREIEKVNISVSTDDKNDKDGKKENDAKKEKVTVTAWYTPDIPVSNGPGNYGGLPGMILEINNGSRIIVCTEVVMNPSEKTEIKEPKGGKVVSRSEYNKIYKDKMDEMRERYKSRNGGGVQFQIGG